MFKLSLSVRDYECDMQGIVNNAVYQNYLEHARHEFLLTCGRSFAQLVDEGIHAVLVRIEIDFKQSLSSGDHFDVSVKMSRKSRLKMLFEQEITRTSDNVLAVKAKAVAVLLGPDGRVLAPDKLLEN